jgi:hypothetical protein
MNNVTKKLFTWLNNKAKKKNTCVPANTNFIVFGLTQPGFKPMIYHIQGEHASHYTGMILARK